ncbi:MAG: ATP-grasp domain-containing protein [Cryobacterium sp.]|nr:ATP-grasp domain-containing protein [Oligoflexia bacterium]
MKIVLLFDLSIPLKPEQYAEYLKTDDWASEAHILATLNRLGHDVIPLGIHDDLDLLLRELKREKPDLIFNLSEAFGGDRRFEPHLVSLIELLGIPYTGATSNALNISKDKGLAKKILSYHRIQIPHFLISRKASPMQSLADLKYPVFIKPLNLEASEGISQLSFAETKKDALERVRYLHERFETDVIIEEFIDGREIYVGILGNERLSALPPRELYFREVPEGEPKFASFKAKWDDDYRKKWGIRTATANLSEDMIERLEEICKKVYRVLGLCGYGRIDLRITPAGEIFCIEANPNPSIEKDGDFALSAIKSGMSYDEVIQKIINLAFAPEPGDTPRTGTRRKKK